MNLKNEYTRSPGFQIDLHSQMGSVGSVSTRLMLVTSPHLHNLIVDLDSIRH